MNFAILRHGKIKSTGVGCSLAHNHRLTTDLQKSGLDVEVQGSEVTEPKVNIDTSLSHLNQYSDGDVRSKMAEKMPTKRKARTDAVVLVELVLSASPEFFNAIEKDRKLLAKHPKFIDWCSKTREYVAAEFGDSVVDLSLHMDESTPHFHVLTVPLTIDGRLSARDVTSRKSMQDRQTGYALAMAPFGLERGIEAAVTKRKHIKLKDDPPGGSGGAAAQVARQLIQEQEELKNSMAVAKSAADSAQHLLLQKMQELEVKALAKAKATADKVAKLEAQVTELTETQIALDAVTKSLDDKGAELAQAQAALAEETAVAQRLRALSVTSKKRFTDDDKKIRDLTIQLSAKDAETAKNSTQAALAAGLELAEAQIALDGVTKALAEAAKAHELALKGKAAEQEQKGTTAALALAQGRVAVLTTEKTGLQRLIDKLQAAVDRLTTALSAATDRILGLEKKVETMTQENTALQAQLDAKTEADKAKGLDPALFVPQEAEEEPQKAQEAFNEQWGDCDTSRRPAQADFGTLLASCGQQAVFKIRGVDYLVTYPQGTKPPSLDQQTEQQKSGIQRGGVSR